MSHDMSFKGLEANTLNFRDKNYVFFKLEKQELWVLQI